MSKVRVTEVVPETLDFEPVFHRQTDVERTNIVAYSCRNSLPDDNTKSRPSVLEFRIDKTDEFIDLGNTYLEIDFQILNVDGSKCATKTDAKGNVTSAVAPVNNFGYAMFENVDLYVADQKITATDTHYPWWTYVYNLLYKTPAQKETMEGNLWAEDTAGLFEYTTDPMNNRGFYVRYDYTADSKKASVLVPLLLNKSFSKLLPPMMDVVLQFRRAKSSLCLMGPAGSSYIVRVLDAKLNVGKVKLTESGMKRYNCTFRRNRLARIPLTSCHTKVLPLGKGDQNIEWVPFGGSLDGSPEALPKRIFLWQTLRESYNGSMDKNPYNFRDFGLQKLQVLVDTIDERSDPTSGITESISLPLADGFTGDNCVSRIWDYSQQAVNSPCTFSISRFDFAHGYMIAVVDLMSCGGRVRIKIDYDKPLPEPVSLFCLGEFDEELTMDNKQILRLNGWPC